MAVYFCVLAGLIFNGCMYELNHRTKGAKKCLFFCSNLLLVCISGFRYMVGTDYGTYMQLYNTYKTQEISLFDQPALCIIARISLLVYDDYATWFFIMAAITIGFIMAGIYRNGFSFWFSILLYLFVGCWHESFNIVKQYAGAAILFFGYKNIVDGKFLKWFIYCLIAATFHISALFMLPMFFLVKAKRLSVTRTCVLIALVIIISLNTDLLFEIMAELKMNSGVTNKDSILGTRNVKWQRILVAGAPMIMTCLFWKKYKVEDSNFAVLFYLSLMNFLIFCFIGGQSVYLSRICVYTNIFNILLIPYLVKPFKSTEKMFFISLILVLYFIFWIYDLMKVPETFNFYWIFER